MNFCPPAPQRARPAPPLIQHQRQPSPPPPLPAEVLKNIFGHLLPPTTKSIRTFELRYTRLRPLALVSKSWGAIARALLLERVYLPAWQQCAKFRKTMDGESSSGMGRLTTELRIGQVEPTGNLLLKHPQFVPRVLVQTPFVTSLWLEEVMIDPADLSVLKDLRVLHLVEVALRFSKSDDTYLWHLPNLSTLYCDDCQFDSAGTTTIDPEPLFSKLTLPALAHLYWTWDSRYSHPYFEGVAPQLEVLYLREIGAREDSPKSSWEAIPPTLFRSLHSLQHLSFNLNFPSDLNEIVSIPSPLVSLHLHSDPEDVRIHDQALLLMTKPPCLDRLDVLFLPPVPAHERWMNRITNESVQPSWRSHTAHWATPADLVELGIPGKDPGQDPGPELWMMHVRDIVASDYDEDEIYDSDDVYAPINSTMGSLDEDEEGEQEDDIEVGGDASEEQALAAHVMRTLEEEDDIYDAEADDEIDEQAYDGFADP